MQLKFTTRSYVLIGAGEGTAMIDADSIFHATGFPYIPGRRVKGLLRESLVEVMEMFGEEKEAIQSMVARLFGYEGSDGPKGGLIFPNLYPEHWDQLLHALQRTTQEDRRRIFHPENIKRHFSSEIPQTAVVEGVAKDSSLRMYRVLNPALTFVAPFQIPDDAAEKQWLKRAVANLRRAGTRRNKGFGTVKLELLESDEVAVQTPSTTNLAQNTNCLRVRIKTISPVLLSQRDGEQNTVFTERHISGTHLRGLIAAQIIRHKALGAHAHQDSEFARWILSGAVGFSDCTLQGAAPFPLNLQQQKGESDGVAMDAFLPTEGKSKPIDGLGFIDGRAISRIRPKTSFMFHNSRPNRAAGKSMDNDESEGIFYYEALTEGQEFVGEISAVESKDILGLAGLLGTTFKCQMGRSRSAQYGSVEVRIEPLHMAGTTPKDSPSHRYYLMLETPLILLNEMGEATADAGLLQSAFVRKGLVKTNIVHAITQTKWVEQYNATWQSKTSRLQAFAAGSVFLLTSAPEDWAILSQFQALGEQKELGFGKVRLFPCEAFAQALMVREEPLLDSSLTAVDEPKELRAIRQLHAQRALRIQANQQAIRDATARKMEVPNHLSSWILNKLGSRRLDPGQWRKGWTQWLEQSKNRNQPAFRTLDEFQLFESLLALQPWHSPESQYPEEWGHPYWTTFFETLRKRNKKEKQ
jgi:CRISPR-associated protein Csx10